MILIDYSQLCISSYMAIYKSSLGSEDIDEDIMRHAILDSIRAINSKFRNEYDELIIAVDAPKSWRKKFFPYYKANRNTTRDASSIDWPQLFAIIATVKEELIQYFPYKVVEAFGAEADDIIGVLARQCSSNAQKCLIVSGDKDFIQLQVDNIWVKQWDKINQRWIEERDPKRYLFEHVLKGDRGDGIPNVLSPGDALVTKTRQSSMTTKRIEGFLSDTSQLKTNKRFVENLKLIDLNFTPKVLQDNIIDKYRTAHVNERKNLLNYFMSKRLKKLASSIGDF